MTDYVFQPEVARLAIVVSVIVSMLYYERMQVTSGGAIVPAYLALFLPAPVHVLMTVAVGYATFLLVSVVMARRVILHGRRKFEIEILVGLALLAVLSAVARPVSWVTPTLVGLSGIGFVVPGVLAHDMFRQRPGPTVVALGVTTAVVALILFVLVSIVQIAPLTLRPPMPAAVAGTAFSIQLLLPAVTLGVVLGIILYGRLGLRSGGFVSGAYLALVLNRPLDVAFAFVVALLTYGIVRYVLMRHLLIFGRRKLSAMILVGSILAWAAELSITTMTGGAYTPWWGFTVVTLIVPALLANDMQRQGVERTLWGAAIVALAVFGAMSMVEGLRAAV